MYLKYFWSSNLEICQLVVVAIGSWSYDRWLLVGGRLVDDFKKTLINCLKFVFHVAAYPNLKTNLRILKKMWDA